jgi:hypothetical protein
MPRLATSAICGGPTDVATLASGVRAEQDVGGGSPRRDSRSDTATDAEPCSRDDEERHVRSERLGRCDAEERADRDPKPTPDVCQQDRASRAVVGARVLATPIRAGRRIFKEGERIEVQQNLAPQRQACASFARKQRFDVLVIGFYFHRVVLNLKQVCIRFVAAAIGKSCPCTPGQACHPVPVRVSCPEMKRDPLAPT